MIFSNIANIMNFSAFFFYFYPQYYNSQLFYTIVSQNSLDEIIIIKR